MLSAENARELDAPAAKELAEHLAVCSECNAQARTQRRVDQLLGRAMRDVPVPVGLRTRILDRLAAEERRPRRWFRPVTGVLVAAACLGLFVWAWYFLGVGRKTPLSVEQVVMAFNATPPGDAAKVDENFKRLGLSPCAPHNVNYSYLLSPPSKAPLPGFEKELVPHLVFGKGKERALMFIINVNRYRLEEWENAMAGYRLNAREWQDDKNPNNPPPSVVYLVLHTGNNCDWLRAP